MGLAVNGLNDVDPDVLAAFSKTVETLSSLGVEVVETETPSAEDYRLATSLGSS